MRDYILSACAPCDLTPEWMEKRDINYVPYGQESVSP